MNSFFAISLHGSLMLLLVPLWVHLLFHLVVIVVLVVFLFTVIVFLELDCGLSHQYSLYIQKSFGNILNRGGCSDSITFADWQLCNLEVFFDVSHLTLDKVETCFGKVAFIVVGSGLFWLVDHFKKIELFHNDSKFSFKHQTSVIELIRLMLDKFVMLFGSKRSNAERTAVTNCDPTVKTFWAESLLAARDDFGVVRKGEADGTIHSSCNE